MDLEALVLAEQVDALLKGRAVELVKSKYGSFHPAAFSEVFTITRAEILDYLRCNYKLEQVVRMKPGHDGGFYAIPAGRNYQVYEQYEKGPKYDRGVVSVELKVWALFVDYLVRTSGTGLDFE